MNLKDLVLPEDDISCEVKNKLRKLKIEHDIIVHKYNEVVLQYSNQSWDIKQKFMKENEEYVFRGCKHSRRNRRPRSDFPNIEETYCEICNKTVWVGHMCKTKYVDETQNDRAERLWQYVYPTFPSIYSLDCEYENCG